MYQHYCLPAGIITVPQEMMRPLGSDHLEVGPLQRRNDCAAGHGRQCPSCVRGGDRYQLVDRRGEIPIRRRDGLAILPHHLQTQLDRLPRVRLRFFESFAIGNQGGKLGTADREPALGFGPEVAEISNKRWLA